MRKLRIIIFIYFAVILLPSKLSSQSEVNNYSLEIKRAIYNKYPDFIDKILNERGDYEIFMNVFDDESSTIIDDNLIPENYHYSKLIEATAYQQMLAVRNFDVEDSDWGGMPLYIGEPEIFDGDTTGEINIIVKHCIKNNTPSYTFLKDTQIIEIIFSFNRKVLRNEEGKRYNFYRFKVKNSKLHPLYRKPIFIKVQLLNQIISFGKKKGNKTIIELDSFTFTDRTFYKSDSFYRIFTKHDTYDNLNQLILYKGNNKKVINNVILKNDLVETLEHKQEVKLGEISFSLFSNFGSNWLNLAKISGSTFSGGNVNVTSGGGIIGLGFPIVRYKSKKTDLSFSNIPYLTIGFGYTYDNSFVGLNNLIETQQRIDFYGNTYTRIADYHSYTDRQISQNGNIAIGFESRTKLPLRNNFFNWGLSAVGCYNFSTEYAGSTCTVTYSGLYSSYFNIKISDNGIMDYGTYSFARDPISTKSQEISFGFRPHIGVAFELIDNMAVNAKSFFFMPINLNKGEKVYPSTLGVDYNRFRDLNEIGATINKRTIGFELSLLIHL